MASKKRSAAYAVTHPSFQGLGWSTWVSSDPDGSFGTCRYFGAATRFDAVARSSHDDGSRPSARTSTAHTVSAIDIAGLVPVWLSRVGSRKYIAMTMRR